MSKNFRQHFYLISGIVLIQDPETEVITGVAQNGMLTTDDQIIGVHELGKAQQSLQIALFNKMGEAPNVIDVILSGFSYLGRMTQARFEQRPEGMGIKEVEKPVVEDISFEQMMENAIKN